MPATKSEGVRKPMSPKPTKTITETRDLQPISAVQGSKMVKGPKITDIRVVEESGTTGGSATVAKKSKERKIDETDTPPTHSFTITNQTEFESKVQKCPNTVIIDFFATWCDPCKTLAPRLEAIIQRMKGKVQLAKIDIDEMVDLALEYDVSSVPVLVRMKDGQEQGRMVGLQAVPQLEAFIQSEETGRPREDVPREPHVQESSVKN